MGWFPGSGPEGRRGGGAKWPGGREGLLTGAHFTPGVSIFPIGVPKLSAPLVGTSARFAPGASAGVSPSHGLKVLKPLP